MSGNTAGNRHNESMAGSQPQAAPITKHKKKKLLKLYLACPVTACRAQIPSLSHCMWGACAGGERLGDATESWLLRDVKHVSSLHIPPIIPSSHAPDVFLVGFCRCDVYPTV